MNGCALCYRCMDLCAERMNGAAARSATAREVVLFPCIKSLIFLVCINLHKNKIKRRRKMACYFGTICLTKLC